MGRRPRSREEVVADLMRQLATNYSVNEQGCWVWLGSSYDNGYARLSRFRPVSGLHERGHIAAYLVNVGPIPAGLFVCHKCDNKGCINPKHLWLGSNKENQLDAKQKGVFEAYWTPERRAAKSSAMSGSGNPMFGKTGAEAPCFGRTGQDHPMFGKHHTVEAKQKISASLKLKKAKS